MSLQRKVLDSNCTVEDVKKASIRTIYYSLYYNDTNYKGEVLVTMKFLLSLKGIEPPEAFDKTT